MCGTSDAISNTLVDDARVKALAASERKGVNSYRPVVAASVVGGLDGGGILTQKNSFSIRDKGWKLC